MSLTGVDTLDHSVQTTRFGRAEFEQRFARQDALDHAPIRLPATVRPAEDRT